MAKYLALWDELWTRDPGDRQALAAAAHPLQPDYARLFAGYPSRVLDQGAALGLSRAGLAVSRRQDFPVIYQDLEALVTPQRVRALLVVARHPAPAGALAAKLQATEPGMDQETAEALLLWALKHDLLEYAGHDA